MADAAPMRNRGRRPLTTAAMNRCTSQSQACAFFFLLITLLNAPPPVSGGACWIGDASRRTSPEGRPTHRCRLDDGPHRCQWHAAPSFVPSIHAHPDRRLVRQLTKRSVTKEPADADRSEEDLVGNLNDSQVRCQIRDCSYDELGAVADLIVLSFYDAASLKSPWKQLYRMGELNRIQQGFAYPAQRDKHRMLVATVPTITAAKGQGGKAMHTVIGYCDVDDRPPNRPTGFDVNPRPYLSDLCTDPNYRRQGIAKALVEECEKYCHEVLHRQSVYIRVEKHNVAALRLYEGMGYRPVDPYDVGTTDADLPTTTRATTKLGSDPASEKIQLLRKDLNLVNATSAVHQLQQFTTADQGLR